MLISRLLPVGGMALRHAASGSGRKFISTSSKRMSGAPWTYREFTMPSNNIERATEAVGAVVWWWVFWHFFTDYGHIIGEDPFIDANCWSDAELGIPPDDADDPE